MNRPKFYVLAIALLIAVIACKEKDGKTGDEKEFEVQIEEFELDNGLKVLMHVDRSDPVVAVALTAHVGSAREKEGRTGFAHLFEHLLFLESENLGKGGLDAMSARIGGSGANGSTNRDITNYYQTVPKDALEKMIWAEADKLGYFINTVTEPVLAKEKQVVKNEKRQGVDNRPYGHEDFVIDRNLYPSNHPYHWQVIGSLQDLQNATLQDVKDFYNKYYTPNNSILTISGDFDMAQAKEWVQKYFGEIPKGKTLDPIEVPAVELADNKLLYYEDNFARLPQLTMTWPAVKRYDKDNYALQALVKYLSDGKEAPLNQVIKDSLNLAPSLNMVNYASEHGGSVRLTVKANSEVDLDTVQQAIFTAFDLFEKNPLTNEDLEKQKAQSETRFYNSLSSVLGKGFQLASYEIYAGDAGYINKDLEMIKAVTVDDVMRVYKKYVKNQPYVATSFVPKGSAQLALENSSLAQVVEEKIDNNADDAVDPNIVATYERTPSSFDRTVEPDYGDAAQLAVPDVWNTALNSGIVVYGITNDEVPLVSFSMDIAGGPLFEDDNTAGATNILAQLLTKGTASKTTAQLEDAIDKIGSSIRIYSGNNSLTVSGTTLARNYDETMQLVSEILLEPRWDEEEFELIKKNTITSINEQKANPNVIAGLEFDKLLYGENHPYGKNPLGTVAAIENLSIEQLKTFYGKIASPSRTSYRVVGSVNLDEVKTTLTMLDKEWKSNGVSLPAIENAPAVTASKIYFYDVPGAKQSILNFGHSSLPATHPDYYDLQIMNYRLGGGGFASILMQELRESKGYTYGIGSRFSGDQNLGSFTIGSGVRSNVTLESTALINEILKNYADSYDEEDLEVTQGYLVKSSARAYETAGAKLSLLQQIDEYNLPADFAVQRQQIVESMTVDEVKKIAQQYLRPDQMIYLIVGDAQTQLERLEQLGYGKPIRLN